MHDKNGLPIKTGDVVTVEAVIRETYATDEFCNVQIGIGYENGKENGPHNVQSIATINSKQVELLTPVEPAPEEQEFRMQFFNYGHLHPHLQAVSKPFGDLARVILRLPQNDERTVALRKLLEAKDCAVRALIAK